MSSIRFFSFVVVGSASIASVALVFGGVGACGTNASAPGAADATATGEDAATSLGNDAPDAGTASSDDAFTTTTSDASASRWCVGAGGEGGVSKWVYAAGDGGLAYAALSDAGDRILDFSYAGYGGGGVAIPNAPVAQTVAPSGGDDTAAIQAAIDAVAKLPLTNGVRGAVLLKAGTFELAGSLSIAASGVVLRGSGSGSGGTLVNVTGSPRNAISFAGTGSYSMQGTAAKITDAYVPSGTRTFHVDSTSGLAVGKPVLVVRPVTQAWIDFMGMNTLVRNGSPQTWIAAGSTIPSDRIIEAIDGDTVTVDAPLSDSLDAKYVSPPGATVQEYSFAGRIEQVGLESMHVVAPKQVVMISEPTFSFVSMNAVLNGWIRDVVGEDFTNGIALGSTAKWVTIEDSSMLRSQPIDADAGLPFHISVDGQQTLVQRSTTQASDMFAYATMGRAPGPNVVLELVATGTPMHVQPHMRWATGLLSDNVSVPQGTIDYINRGSDGSGHGWAIGFGVVWNSSATSLTMMQPPGSENWAIGTTGTFAKTDTGMVDSPGKPVVPKSLYLAQLCERLGPQAIANIGY
jgi:hypothetical protein